MAKAKTKAKSNWALQDTLFTLDEKIETKYLEVPLNLDEDFLASKMSTGSLMLDVITGGGFPAGTWVTLYGLESSGKSTGTYQVVKSALDLGIPKRDFFDYENSLATPYFANIVKMPLEQVLGKKDKEDNWIVKPKVRHYMPEYGEVMFKLVANKMRTLPDLMTKRGEKVMRYSAKVAKALGIPDEKVLFKEEGYVYLEDTGNPIKYIVFVDSTPEMLPQALYEDADKNPMAQQARMFSNLIPLIRPSMRRKGVVVVAINHVRLRPGVTMGCFPYGQKVMLEDNSLMDIGKIVNQKIDTKVMSYNTKKDCFEPKRIIGHWNNGKSNKWIKLTVSMPSVKKGHNKAYMTVTPEHEVYISETKKVAAKSLKKGSKILMKSHSPKINAVQQQIIIGSILGDGWFSSKADCEKTGFSFAHDVKQLPYLLWKEKILSNFVVSHYGKGKDIRTIQLKTFPEEWLLKIKQECKEKVRHSRDYHFSKTLIKYSSPLALAVWFMDDGAKGEIFNKARIGIDSYPPKEAQKLINALNKKFNLQLNIKDRRVNKAHKRHNGISRGVVLCAKFYELILPYIHSSMVYKLPKKYQAVWNNNENKIITFSQQLESNLYTVQGTVLQNVPAKTRRSNARFDIEVEDNHNYVLNGGIVVGNSPEYTPCGELLKLATDIRLRVSNVSIPNGKGKIEEEYNLDGELERYIYSKYAVKKNKKAHTLGKDCVIRVCIEKNGKEGYGIDPVYDLFEYLRTTKQIKKRGEAVTITLPGVWENVKITWDDLKRIVHKPFSKELLYKFLQDKESKKNPFSAEKKAAMETLEMILQAKKPNVKKFAKLMDIRAKCLKQIKSGKCFELIARS